MTNGSDRSPRHDFRLLHRRRNGYDGALMVDVQLQVAATGAIVWAQSFSDEAQADEFTAQVEHDLDELANDEFRRKYSVPSTV